MTLELIEWSDDLAFMVFQDLDFSDRVEAAIWRGDDAQPLALWADWRLWGGWRAVTRVACWREGRNMAPFAVLGLQPVGARGVMQGALLARCHRDWRRPLVHLVRRLRAELPDRAAEWGLTRIECRTWSDHPTADRLLTAVGFRLEADLAGMPGAFRQYALILDHGDPACA